MVAIKDIVGDTAESHGNQVNGVLQKLNIKTRKQLATLLMIANVHLNVGDIVPFFDENGNCLTRLNNKIINALTKMWLCLNHFFISVEKFQKVSCFPWQQGKYTSSRKIPVTSIDTPPVTNNKL